MNAYSWGLAVLELSRCHFFQSSNEQDESNYYCKDQSYPPHERVQFRIRGVLRYGDAMHVLDPSLAPKFEHRRKVSLAWFHMGRT